MNIFFSFHCQCEFWFGNWVLNWPKVPNWSDSHTNWSLYSWWHMWRLKSLTIQVYFSSELNYLPFSILVYEDHCRSMRDTIHRIDDTRCQHHDQVMNWGDKRNVILSTSHNTSWPSHLTWFWSHCLVFPTAWSHNCPNVRHQPGWAWDTRLQT